MGIKPLGTESGVEKNYRVDGSDEANDLIADAEQAGTKAGQVFAEVSATAESANTGMAELSARIAALESSNTWVSDDTLNVIARRGSIVTASGRVALAAGATYTDIALPDWAVTSTVAFIQFPAAYAGQTGRGQVKMADKVIRIFGTAGTTLAYTVTWAI